MATTYYRNSFFIFHLVFIIAPLGQPSSTHIRFIRVPHKMTWLNAQRYCREHYTDLATVRSVDDNLALIGMCAFNSKCWIGFNRVNETQWSWSSGESVTFKNWYGYDFYQSGPSHNSCGAMADTFWHTSPCHTEMVFICDLHIVYDDFLVLVKQYKTWEGAREQCMTLNADREHGNSFNSPYTLAYIDFGGDTSGAEEIAQYAQTEEVWIGLRFLAGHWLWVNGAPLQDQLPICPQPGRYCGAMSKTGQLLHEDCVERRKFLCVRTK